MKDKMTRQFTVMASEQATLLIFNVLDLNKMQVEFLELYESLFKESFSRIEQMLEIKLKSIKKCQKTQLLNPMEKTQIIKRFQDKADSNKKSKYNIKCYKFNNLTIEREEERQESDNSDFSSFSDDSEDQKPQPKKAGAKGVAKSMILGGETSQSSRKPFDLKSLMGSGLNY